LVVWRSVLRNDVHRRYIWWIMIHIGERQYRLRSEPLGNVITFDL